MHYNFGIVFKKFEQCGFVKEPKPYTEHSELFASFRGEIQFPTEHLVKMVVSADTEREELLSLNIHFCLNYKLIDSILCD